MIHAYGKTFLPDVQRNLGFASDFAVNGCGVKPDSFYDFFIVSKVAEGIENGSPVFVCGCSGTELALSIFDRVGFDYGKSRFNDNSILFTRSAEYWAGWILAYYQWNTGKSFARIRDYVSFSQIVQMYNPLHEASEEKFLDVMDSIIKQKTVVEGTNLQQLRKAAGLTQSRLAELSGVNLRTLQQYEIGAKDINKASGAAINALACVLNCNFYDIMELG